jgi:hypothetical protein
MKNLLTLLLLTGILSACNHTPPIIKKELNDSSEKSMSGQETAKEKLTLNNGAKWKVDTGTNNNAIGLKGIIERFQQGNDHSLTAYKYTQDVLQRRLNKMISECKMTGQEHEALHRWLEPLISQVQKLNQTNTVPDAARTMAAFDVQVNLYTQYFEL